MTVSRAKAISSIEDNLQLVADRLARIFVHAPSGYDNKWEKDVGDFFITIIRHANKVSTPSGKLPSAVLIEKLNDCAWVTKGNIPLVHGSSKYRGLLKSTPDSDTALEVATRYLVPALREVSAKVAVLILTDILEQRKVISSLLVSVVQGVRDKHLMKG
jgi:hypothetical protein